MSINLTKNLLAEKVWTHTALRGVTNGDVAARQAVELVFAELGIEELCASLAFDERYSKKDADYERWMKKHLADALGARVFREYPPVFTLREPDVEPWLRVLSAHALCITQTPSGEKKR